MTEKANIAADEPYAKLVRLERKPVPIFSRLNFHVAEKHQGWISFNISNKNKTNKNIHHVFHIA